MDKQRVLIFVVLVLVSYYVMLNKTNYKLIHREAYIAKGEYFQELYEIERDNNGSPLLTCINDASCAFALAVSSCEDDFYRMQYQFSLSKAVQAQVTL